MNKKIAITLNEINTLINDFNNVYGEILEEINNYFYSDSSLYYFYSKGKLFLTNERKLISYFDQGDEKYSDKIIKKDDKRLRSALKNNEILNYKLKLLDEMISIFLKIKVYNSDFSPLATIKDTDNRHIYYSRIYFDSFAISVHSLRGIYINNLNYYHDLKNLINKYYNFDYSLINTKERVNTSSFFSVKDKIKTRYLNMTLEKYDLSCIIFDGKNISGIDISCNPEVKINFDKIVKDLSNANIEGYNLNKYKFVGWNLCNTNLCGTNAIVDLQTCSTNGETKMNPGTMFDSNNVLMYGDKVLTNEEISNLGIKIYKKVV